MKKKYLGLLLSTIIVTEVNADCKDDANNLMQNANCDFTTDIAEWSIAFSTGNISHNANDDYQLGVGMAGSASVTGTSAGFDFSSTVQSACVSLPDTNIRTTGIWIKGDPSVDLSCYLESFDFSDNVCTLGGFPIGNTGAFQVAAGSDWTLHSYDITPGQASNFTYMRVRCSNPQQFNYGIDNAFITTQGGLPVELQSFSVD